MGVTDQREAGFPCDKAAAAGNSKGKEGLPMTAEFLWNLFLRTGLPEAYLLYRKILGT
ncbi:MAG: hypothetical protein ACI3XJ_04685 [Oscillospiraceae bacterium]